MPAYLDPVRRVKCTYKNCTASFATEKEMKRHKKNAREHDYCEKCDEDFDCYDDYTEHKAFRPDNHQKACRLCGEEFKSDSGLRRHIDLSHRIDQKLRCIGCEATFPYAALLTQHLEFNGCKVISSAEFQGHIVHKHLIATLLDDEHAMARFQQKVARHSAANDTEEGGGVSLNPIDENDEECGKIQYEALEPEVTEQCLHPPKKLEESFPPLSSDGVSSKLGSMTLVENESVEGSTVTKVSTTSKAKTWGTGNAAKELFPAAKPTPPPANSDYSLQQHDQDLDETHGINIMTTRFWDPTSRDWHAERFYDTMIAEYFCPFPCEQHFSIPGDLERHILDDHRISSMRCPRCLKQFSSCTAVVVHCESRASKCGVNRADDFNKFLDKLTGGFLSVSEEVRPDHVHNPTVQVMNPESGRVEKYQPPVAEYLKYSTSKPVDWKEPPKTVQTSGRMGNSTRGSARGTPWNSGW